MRTATASRARSTALIYMTKSDRPQSKRRAALRPLKVTTIGTPDPRVVARLLVDLFGRELHERLSNLPVDAKGPKQ